MYLAIIVLLMAVFPLVSIIVEWLLPHDGGDLLFVVGKWFVFWAVGIRLLLAGARQVANPAFTAEKIFDLRDRSVLPIVQELGFANLAIGLLGALAVFNPGWVVPAAITGGLFYGLAGFKHALRHERNAKENIALISDICIFVVLALFLAIALLR